MLLGCCHFVNILVLEIIIIALFSFFVIECECISKADIIELLNDDCLDNPCPNGKCIDLANDYKCDCNPGFAGKNCEFSCPHDKPFYREVDGTCHR